MRSRRALFRRLVLAVPILALREATSTTHAPRLGTGLQDSIRVEQLFTRDTAIDARWSASYYRRVADSGLAVAGAHPRTIWHAARAAARAGDTVAVRRLLERLESVGLGYDIARDRAFQLLPRTPWWQVVRAHLLTQSSPILASDTAFTIMADSLVPESVAFDPRFARLYIGSIARGVILQRGRDGVVRRFAGPDLGEVLGMKVDTVHQLLWALTHPRARDADSRPMSARRRARLLAFDLGTGRIVWEAIAEDDGEHLFNDLTLARDGMLFLTDSDAGAVYRVRIGARVAHRLPLTAAPPLDYPNGIAMLDESRHFAVADAMGLRVVDGATGRVRNIRDQHGLEIPMIDGLYSLPGAGAQRCLIGIQTAIGYTQVVRIVLDSLEARSGRVTVLERMHPAYEEPTTGVMVGDTLVYVANSQLSRLDTRGRIARTPQRETILLRLPVRCAA